MNNNIILQNLHEYAKCAMLRSYSPYSNFSVGASIMSSSGKFYLGCNIENSSYPCGNCAESSAISAMILSGDREIDHIMIVGGKDAISSELCYPCGNCRQKINEFASTKCMVHLANANNVLKSIIFSELLPYSFNKNDLI